MTHNYDRFTEQYKDQSPAELYARIDEIRNSRVTTPDSGLELTAINQLLRHGTETTAAQVVQDAATTRRQEFISDAHALIETGDELKVATGQARLDTILATDVKKADVIRDVTRGNNKRDAIQFKQGKLDEFRKTCGAVDITHLTHSGQQDLQKANRVKETELEMGVEGILHSPLDQWDTLPDSFKEAGAT